MSYDSETLATIRQRWNSGRHVGEAKPVMRAYCRTVKLIRRVTVVEPEENYSHVPGWEGGRKIWKGTWKPQTGWTELPNVASFDGNQTFDSNGVMSATLELDNVAMTDESGVAGAYRAIRRGYYAPFYGWKPRNRPRPGEETNEWFDILNDKSTQVMVVAGYGDAVVPIFEGLINDVDMTSRPDKIVLTCRDGGQTLTDQHVFINAKIKKVRDPITFADRADADKVKNLGYGAEASDTAPGFPARFVRDNNTKTFWKSSGRNNSSPQNNLPWLQIGLPHGRYESIELHPEYKNMTAYIAIKAKDKNAPGNRGAKKHQSEIRYQNGEWIDEGLGTIPGTNIPYIKKIDSVKARDREYSFPDYGYDLGDDSKVRVYFDNLREGKASRRDKSKKHRAGVIKLAGVRRKLRKEARKEKWILVDDLADVVRTVLQWAGLNDWEVETTGVRIKEKATFNRGDYLIDIIKAAAEQVGYVFYTKPREEFSEDPGDLALTDNDESMGIAVFRQANAMRNAGVRDPVEFVHEDRTLTGLNVRLTDEPLAYNIRVRGREAGKKKGGRYLGADRTRRYMYVYRPPWSRSEHPGGNWPEGSAKHDYRNANIKKYVVHHDNKLRDNEECEIAALFIAFNQAMASATAQFEAPCLPSIHLDHQTAVLDTGTGLSARVYIASRQIRFRSGEGGSFKMALSGALLDLPDIQRVRRELKKSLRKKGYDPGLSEWELENHGRTYRNSEVIGL